MINIAGGSRWPAKRATSWSMCSLVKLMWCWIFLSWKNQKVFFADFGEKLNQFLVAPLLTSSKAWFHSLCDNPDLATNLSLSTEEVDEAEGNNLSDGLLADATTSIFEELLTTGANSTKFRPWIFNRDHWSSRSIGDELLESVGRQHCVLRPSSQVLTDPAAASASLKWHNDGSIFILEFWPLITVEA